MLDVDGKQIPETLEELLDPARTAHVVIDLQNDCCHPHGTCATAGADVSVFPRVIEQARRLVAQTRPLGVLQVFVRLISLPGGLSDSPAWIRLRHRLAVEYGGGAGIVHFCEAGSWGAELVDGLGVEPGDLVVDKHRSSAFFGTNLDMLLRSNGIDTILFSGCTTEGCVESTVRDAGFLDYFAVVVEDAVGSDSRELHEASLRVMRAYRADVMTLDAAVRALGRPA